MQPEAEKLLSEIRECVDVMTEACVFSYFGTVYDKELFFSEALGNLRCLYKKDKFPDFVVADINKLKTRVRNILELSYEKRRAERERDWENGIEVIEYELRYMNEDDDF